MPRIKHSRAEDVNLNLTSMLDVVFQLIVFFLLITNFTSAELPELEVPDPIQSTARESEERAKITINVLPDEVSSGQAGRIRVGLLDLAPGDYGRLTDMLQLEFKKNPEVEIDLRADISVHYSQVQPVMEAITNAGIGRINLVAKTFTDTGV